MITTTTALKNWKPIGETFKMIKTCTYCKKEFDAKRIDKNYCSASCRQLNHLQRKAVEMFGVAVKEENVKASIDTSNENVKTDEQSVKMVLSEVLKEEKQIPEIVKEKKGIETVYVNMPSRFIEEVTAMYKSRSIKHSHKLVSDDRLVNKNLEWINTRLRCLIEAVLFISERNSLSLADLIELTNAFIYLIKSEQFKKLPENYPYKFFVKDFRNKLKSVCMENSEAEDVPLKLSRKLKIELIVYRCELREVAPKIKFSELNFKNE
jgi:hypothetical protein